MTQVLEFLALAIVSIAGFMIGWNLSEILKRKK